MKITRLILATRFVIFVSNSAAFSTFLGNFHVAPFPARACSRQQRQHVPSTRASSLLVMRDASASYWFSVGDQVRVVADVKKAGINLRDRTGEVVQTWEKCDVDPTCCCAEQVDLGMAVRVKFPGNELTQAAEGSFLHYFAEEELLAEKGGESSLADEAKGGAAFDGMSCVAFKLDALGSSKPRKLASFDPNES